MKKYIKNFFWNVLTIISNIAIQREPNVIVIGAWMGLKFADNSRYLYQFLKMNEQDLGLKKVVWVTRRSDLNSLLNSSGYESYLCGTKESNYWHLKAGIHIICNAANENEYTCQKADIDTRFSWGAKKINLWHGLGVVKSVGKESTVYCLKNDTFLGGIKEKINRGKKIKRIFDIFRVWPQGENYFLTTTEAATNQFRRFSAVSPNYIYSQLPRYCQCPKLLRTEKEIIEIISRYNVIFLYLPTFRTEYTAKSTFDFENVANNLIDIIELNNILWIQKAHSASAKSFDTCFNRNILNLQSDFDINVLFPYITFLVTDYSSAASDARFFNKPVLFYVPDIEEFRQGDRGFTPEAEELLNGPHFLNIKDLRNGIIKYIKDPNSAKPDSFDMIRDKYCGKKKDMCQIWMDIKNAIAD